MYRRYCRATAAALVLMILGAVTTATVAWYLAAHLSIAGTEWTAKDQSYRSGEWYVNRWHPPPIMSGSLPEPDPDPPAVRLVIGWQRGNDLRPSDNVSFDVLSAVASSRVRRLQRDWEQTLASAGSPPPQFHSILWDARGWPRPALACEWQSDGERPEHLTLSWGIAPDHSTNAALLHAAGAAAQTALARVRGGHRRLWTGLAHAAARPRRASADDHLAAYQAGALSVVPVRPEWLGAGCLVSRVRIEARRQLTTKPSGMTGGRRRRRGGFPMRTGDGAIVAVRLRTPDGSKFAVFDQILLLSTNTIHRTLIDAIEAAGLQRCEDLFQNLRRNAETDLIASGAAAHAAAAFLGHSVQVSQRHYVQVTDAMFDAAAGVESSSALHLALQHRAVPARTTSQTKKSKNGRGSASAA